MGRFFASQNSKLVPYIPGEQPQDMKYIKLNTNELPYPPSPKVVDVFKNYDLNSARLYPDPECVKLRNTVGKFYNLNSNQVLAANGSDEILAFIFMAFANRGEDFCFPNISYGFYEVYADLFGINGIKVPLKDDFSLCLDDYSNQQGNVIIANPNAPTGMVVSVEEIEKFVINNPNRLLVVDEAYTDFWNDSCVRLIDKYDNLLIVQTLSKSRGFAGMRLGLALGNKELIDDLNKIKYSFNPYNVNCVSQALATAAFEDVNYFNETSNKIVATRQRCIDELRKIGCTVTDSKTNFIFFKYDGITGNDIYDNLRKNGILVRHFNKPLLNDYIRITVGTDSEIDMFIKTMRLMAEGKNNA